jgi:predicted HD superfamily hydrolase involved in NAD metabolism
LDELNRRIQQRVSVLPEGLQAHIYRARDIAIELALEHSVDPQCAALGTLAHDVCRAMPNQELISHATRLGLPIGLVERQVPVLLHGPVGAELLRQEDGLSGHSLYQAVYWHTTAHPSLDLLGKVVFLADKLDHQKIKRYPYQPYLRELAFADLDRAMLEFLSQELISLTRQGQMIHPMMVETRNALLELTKDGGRRTNVSSMAFRPPSN